MSKNLTPNLAFFLASCMALGSGCTQSNDADPSPDPVDETLVDDSAAPSLTAEADTIEYGSCGEFIPFDPNDVAIFDPFDFQLVFAQRLPQPSPLDENVALHVKLPPVADPELQQSLVRVVGTDAAAMVMFSSDALVELGHLEESPGEGFFTAFAKIDEEEFAMRAESDMEIFQDEHEEFGMVFRNRQAIARAVAQPFDFEKFSGGALVGLSGIQLTPVSTPTNWGESVFITDPEVVNDPSRTYDTCEQSGNECGPWTFCHLMTEMANESRTGISPEEFALAWLEEWTKDTTINGDTIAARHQIQSEIIDPWLQASGGKKLDLKKAPFRLLAIVNRLDLRSNGTVSGRYGLSGVGVPLDAGELRFVFGAMKPEANGGACEPLPFTTIFEYGVPFGGCDNVRTWARRWVDLDRMGGFGSAYRAALEALTEQVVGRDAAPSKGNGSALNQLRTNEIALESPWELREFTLTEQDFDSCDGFTDIPTDGFLTPHTVAQTPDDDAHMPTPSADIDAFLASGQTIVPTNFDCSSGSATPLLGANSLASLSVSAFASPQGTWFATGSWPTFDDDRHEFSANTCNGCHTCDTGTQFTHVDPMSAPGSPASLSGFLTGITVPDTQSGTPRSFSALADRYGDLYTVANSTCGVMFPLIPEFNEEFFGFPPGPIFDLEILNELFEQRADLVMVDDAISPIIDDLGMQSQPFSH